MTLSMSQLLWAHSALMLVQFAEKLLVRRGFDDLVRRRILPDYDRWLFVLQHITWLAYLVGLVAMFEVLGTRWVTLALAVGIWATTASLAMLLASLVLRELVPGTVSGLGFFVLQYLVLRDHVGTSALHASQFTLATLLGVALAAWTLFSVLELRRGGDRDGASG